MDAGTKFKVAMVVLGIYVLAFAWLQHLAPPELRKKYLRTSVVGIGVIFGAGVLWANPEWEIALILVPAIALFSFLHYKMLNVCMACGHTIWPEGFRRQRFCSKCGAELRV
jgi:hypothetical protein